MNEQWENTQEELKMNMARNMYGMHAPIKLAMERSLVIKARGPSMLPQRSNLGLDILMGKDETIDFEDFLNGKVLRFFFVFVAKSKVSY